MFYRNFINRKINTRFQPIVRRKAPYLKKGRKSYTLESNVKKYDIGPDIYFDKAPLPNLYYKNEVVLMPKNKDTLFVYWEVREDDFNALKESKNVYDNAVILLFKNKQLYRKITGLSRVGSYYISNVKANRSYQVKLGFENASGEFFEIVRSVRVSTPFGRVSNRRCTTWGMPYYINGRLAMNFYSRHHLPEDHILRQEILDNVLTTGELGYKVDEFGNIIFNGSSDLFMGSSK